MGRESVKASMRAGWQEKEQEETWKAVWEASESERTGKRA